MISETTDNGEVTCGVGLGCSFRQQRTRWHVGGGGNPPLSTQHLASGRPQGKYTPRGLRCFFRSKALESTFSSEQANNSAVPPPFSSHPASSSVPIHSPFLHRSSSISHHILLHFFPSSSIPPFLPHPPPFGVICAVSIVVYVSLLICCRCLNPPLPVCSYLKRLVGKGAGSNIWEASKQENNSASKQFGGRSGATPKSSNAFLGSFLLNSHFVLL